MFVAYRDGFTDPKGVLLPWKSATASKSVDIMVGEAYSVTVVCMTGGTVLTWQASRSISEEGLDPGAAATLQTPCTNPPVTSAVTGTAVQAGTIHLDDQSTPESSAANTPFSLSVVDGMHDLIASDPGDKKALIQRNVAVSGATNLGSIDAATGVALTSVASLTLDNPPKAPTDAMDTTHTETVEARVEVQTKNNSAPGAVFFTGYDLVKKKVSAFQYPSAMLVTGDAQTATFVGTNHPHDTTILTTRMQTRPLDSGAAAGTTTFQLPGLIATPNWGLDPQNRLSVALPSLPALDTLTVSTSGTSTGGMPATYQIDITATFFSDTALARPVFDTDLTGAGGFSASWKIDFKKAYTRDIVSQHDVTNKAGDVIGHETSQFHEDVAAP